MINETKEAHSREAAAAGRAVVTIDHEVDLAGDAVRVRPEPGAVHRRLVRLRLREDGVDPPRAVARAQRRADELLDNRPHLRMARCVLEAAVTRNLSNSPIHHRKSDIIAPETQAMCRKKP